MICVGPILSLFLLILLGYLRWEARPAKALEVKGCRMLRRISKGARFLQASITAELPRFPPRDSGLHGLLLIQQRHKEALPESPLTWEGC